MISRLKIKELALFLNIEESFLAEMDRAAQMMPGFAKWINVAVDDWDLKKINPDDRNKVEQWFKNNDKYIFELSDVHSRATKKRISKQAIKICKINKVKIILDYGGGIGEDSILAAKAGLSATMADLPTISMEFAKWRANYHNVKIDFIEIKNDTPLVDFYDAITCFEVLQHLYEPEIVASHLVDHINPKGLLFITTRFNNPGYSMVLKKNLNYEEGMENFFRKLGLSLKDKIYQYGDGARKKFLYIYQRPS